MAENRGVKTYDLADVDLIRSRMAVGYQQARDALEAAGGDIVEALVWLERHGDGTGDDLSSFVEHMIAQTSEVIGGQQIVGIGLKLMDRAICRFPAALGGFGAATALILGEMLSNCTVEMKYASPERPQGPTDNLRQDHSRD